MSEGKKQATRRAVEEAIKKEEAQRRALVSSLFYQILTGIYLLNLTKKDHLTIKRLPQTKDYSKL